MFHFLDRLVPVQVPPSTVLYPRKCGVPPANAPPGIWSCQVAMKTHRGRQAVSPETNETDVEASGPRKEPAAAPIPTPGLSYLRAVLLL